MSLTRLLRFAVASLACCLAVGQLLAQQPQFTEAQRGRKAVNLNAPRSAPSTDSVLRQRNPPGSQLSYIAIFGAVHQPTVFETSERSVALKTLIERAGGETSESLGTVCMMDLGLTCRIADQQVGNGQVIFVVPRGGSRPTQLLSSRPSASSKTILITGLLNGPRLAKVDQSGGTLGDLLVTLGQPVELLENGGVIAIPPQGARLDLNSELVSSTVVRFIPEAVNLDTLRGAIQSGFRFENPVRLTAPPVSGPANPVIPSSVPVQEKILDQVRTAPPQVTLPLPVTSNVTPHRFGSGIEATGSSSSSTEPMPLPADVQSEEESTLSPPSSKSDGRPPLMMPKTWLQSGDSETESGEGENHERVIERTSAANRRGNRSVMTASATMEDLKPRKPKLAAAALDLAEIDNEEAADSESQTSALFPSPQSWMVLVLLVGIVGSSLLVSRYLTRPEFVASPASPRTEVATHEPTFAQELAPSLPPIQIRKQTQKPKAPPAEPKVPEDEQRFLQRLIMNKVTLIEEEVDPPAVDHLHGVAVGARRMIVHEAHQEIAGPHFQVRAVGDQRAVELRLRRLLRTDRLTKHTDEFVQSADTQEPRESKTGPLERALRTVERGVTQ